MPSISALLGVVLVVAASVATAATPLPPRSDRLIYDTAGVFDDGVKRDLELRHRELVAKAGVAIVVITVPHLVDETIDELAVRAGQTWGVGQAGQDRGLVVALSRDDRKIFVATGYGTEGYLPDGRVGALLDEHAIPYLRQGQLSEGVVRLSNALVDSSAREYGVTLGASGPTAQTPEQPRGGALRLVLLLLGIVGFALLAWRHPLLATMLFAGMGRSRGGVGFGGGMGSGGFGGGGFGGGGAGRGF